MAKQQGKPMNHGGGPSGGGHSDPSPNEALAAFGQGSGMGVVRTETNYQTAMIVPLPRDEKLIERKVVDEATDLAEDFIYAWDVPKKKPDGTYGKERIEGLSIDGAMVLYRNWTNCAIPTRLVSESPTHFVVEATFVDLENGFTLGRLFRQVKSRKMGRMDDDRAEDMSFQIAQSKCQRNVIDKAMPPGLVKKAITAAKAAAEKKYEDVERWRAYILKRAGEHGITHAELEAKSDAKIADWIPSDIAYLVGVFTAIAKRETTITVEFRAGVKAEAAAPEPAASEVAAADPPVPHIPDMTPEARKSEPKASPEILPAEDSKPVADRLQEIADARAVTANAPPAPKTDDFEPPKTVKR